MNTKIKKYTFLGGILAFVALAGFGMTFFNTNLFQSSILPTSTGSSLAETGSGKVAVGVFYFPGWAPNNYEWNTYHSIKDEFPEREKVDGWEDMTTLESMDKEITWAKDHGVDYFIFDWYWDNRTKSSAKHPINDLSYALEAFKKVNNGRLKYTILWCNHGSEALSESDLDQLMKYWEDNYFTDPDFMKLPNGKRLFSYWTWSEVIRALSLDENGQNSDWNRGVQRMQNFYRNLKAKYNLHIAVVSDGVDIRTSNDIKSLETDAIIGWGYLNGNGGYHHTSVSQYEVFKDYAARALSELYKILPSINIEVYPGILPGRNEKPWALIPATQLLQNDPKWFEQQLKLAYLMLEAQPNAFQTIVIQSWNEMGEGAYLMPTKQWQFKALEALKKVKTCMAQHNCDLPELPDEFSPFKQNTSNQNNQTNLNAVATSNSNTNTISSTNNTNSNTTASGSQMSNTNTNTTPLSNLNLNSSADPTKSQLVPPATQYYIGYQTNQNAATSAVRPSAPKAVLFRDIGGHFAETAIKELFQQGIIQGRTMTSFAPNASLNRAEALKLALAATGQTDSAENFLNTFKKSKPSFKYVYFQDVPVISWFASYVGYGFEQKMVKGVNSSSYEPGRAVTRAEFIKIILEGAKINISSEAQKFDNTLSAYFKDVGTASWYKTYVYAAAQKNLIDKKALFNPNRTITRGEAAKIIYSLIK